MVGRGEELVLVPHSEGQGSQRWILAVGLENSFPPSGAAPGCWALGDAEAGTARESRNQVQSLLSAEVGLQATCVPLLPLPGPQEGGSWVRNLIRPGAGWTRKARCVYLKNEKSFQSSCHDSPSCTKPFQGSPGPWLLGQPPPRFKLWPTSPAPFSPALQPHWTFTSRCRTAARAVLVPGT